MKPRTFGPKRPATQLKTLTIAAALLLAVIFGCSNSENSLPTASVSGSDYQRTESTRPLEKPAANWQPRVKVRTSAGEFTLELNAKLAPLTVENFLSYVNSGQYDGTIFHQIESGFIVLGGGYDSHLVQRATQSPVRNEAHNGLKNRRGTIAMARQSNSIDSATSQFFINLGDNASLDFADYDPGQYGYCVFGEVVEGMDVIDRLAKCEVHSTPQFENVPVQPVVIESMRCLK